jgi:sorbitol-specific phosphotransferase system component IIA
MTVLDGPEQKHVTLSKNSLKNKRAGGMVHVSECLPNNCKVLNLTPEPQKKG